MTGSRTTVAVALLLSAAFVVACVEVPDSVRAHFAEPRAGEANNFRKGAHGKAPPSDDAPMAGDAVAAREAPPVASASPGSPSTEAERAPAVADGGAP